MKSIFCLAIILVSTFSFASSRKLKLNELQCEGVKIKSFSGESDSGIELQLVPLSSNPEATVINMRAGVYPSKNWVSVPVFVKKVSPLKGGGFKVSGQPKVVFAGGGSATFTMDVVKVNNVWKASTTVVYQAWSRPASIREYNLTCTQFKVQ